MDQTFSSLSNIFHQNNPLMRKYSLKQKETKKQNLKPIKERTQKELSSRRQLIIKTSSFQNLTNPIKKEPEINQINSNIIMNHETALKEENKDSNQNRSKNLKLLNLSKKGLNNFSSAKHSPITKESTLKFESINGCFFKNQKKSFQHYHPKINIDNNPLNSVQSESSMPNIRFYSITTSSSPIKETPKVKDRLKKFNLSIEANRNNMLNSILEEEKVDEDKAQLFLTLYGHKKPEIEDIDQKKANQEKFIHEINDESKKINERKISKEKNDLNEENNFSKMHTNQIFSSKSYFHINQKTFLNKNKKGNPPKLQFKENGMDNIESTNSSNLSKPNISPFNTFGGNKKMYSKSKFFQKDGSPDPKLQTNFKEEKEEEMEDDSIANIKPKRFTFQFDQWNNIKNLINKNIKKEEILESELIENYSPKLEELEKPIKELKYMVRYMKCIKEGQNQPKRKVSLNNQKKHSKNSVISFIDK